MSQETIKLNIAEIVVSKEAIVVSSALDSGVSVCLFSDVKNGGGIVYYALPELPSNSSDNPLKYGDYAIEKLIDETCKHLEVKSTNLKAKLVGGSTQAIGFENVEIARKLLSKYQIPIVGESIGGTQERKIIFHIQTGRLQVAFVQSGSSKPAAVAVSGKSNRKIKVLIVDDSKTIRDLLFKVLSQDDSLEVVGQAEDPLEAELLLPTAKPDVITLDIHMPRMTGVQWLKTLVPKYKLPVVMITSLELKDGNEVFEALELGAVDYIQKPSLSELSAITPVIREKVINAAYAKVRAPSIIKKFVPSSVSNLSFDPNIVIAIGSSTGGTEALKAILTALPENIPPIVIVQHIPSVFSRAFAERMNSLCPFEVKEAESGDALHTNRVLIAPGGTQMKVVKKTSGLFVDVNDDPPMTRHKPSVDYLFSSVADTIGKKSIGVILTGMGADGTQGMLKMKTKGSMTLSQDEETCVVYGMPKSAWESGASQLEVPLDEIAKKLTQLWGLKKTD